MSELWLDITDIPASGREFSFSDPQVWTGPIGEFGLAHRLEDAVAPMEITFSVTPEGRGMLIRGRLVGAVVTPCDRCAEEARLSLDSTFELYEDLPLVDEISLEPALLRRRGKVLELDVASLAWEQFLLAMPVKPLCEENCPGLCPQCGQNLREGPCGCASDAGDPRLAVFKTLKAPRGSN
jgi:uncharacterized protein